MSFLLVLVYTILHHLFDASMCRAYTSDLCCVAFFSRCRGDVRSAIACDLAFTSKRGRRAAHSSGNGLHCPLPSDQPPISPPTGIRRATVRTPDPARARQHTAHHKIPTNRVGSDGRPNRNAPAGDNQIGTPWPGPGLTK